MSQATTSRIEELEKELLEKKKELAELRRAQPREAIKNYEFETANGPVKLSELFGDRNDLLIPRVEAASIAFYCRQNRALEAIRAEARAVLHPDELESFAEEVAKITPGAVPENTRPETSAAP